MSAARNPGRVVGLWYLVIILVGPLRLIYIPTKLYGSGDAAGTASNIAAHEQLFRFGMASDMICALALIMLVLAFYKLFERVDRFQATLLAIFGGIMPAIMYLINVALDATTLTIVRGESSAGAFDLAQRNALAVLVLRLHDHIVTASLLLAGAWLFPMAILLYRSRFAPRFIAVWLFVAGCCWTVLAFTGFLAPQYRAREFTIFQPAFFAEIAFMLWMVIRGARPNSEKLNAAPAAVAAD